MLSVFFFVLIGERGRLVWVRYDGPVLVSKCMLGIDDMESKATDTI